MQKIAIISSSVRIEKKSDRVALYFRDYINQHQLADTMLIDLNELQFPIFAERLRNLKDPPEKLLKYADLINKSDGIVLVTPEYNGGYPASIKNAIDVLYDEWYRKPVAIATVSAGAFGGSQVLTALQFALWKIRAWTVPAMFPVPNVDKTFDEIGQALDKVSTDKRAAAFLTELIWCMEAKRKMESIVK